MSAPYARFALCRAHAQGAAYAKSAYVDVLRHDAIAYAGAYARRLRHVATRYLLRHHACLERAIAARQTALSAPR